MASMTARGGRKRRIVNEINVVPYIDVMLVLLVIFMVTAPLLSPGVIDLPSVGSSTVKKDVYVEVQIPDSGEMLLILKNTKDRNDEVPVTPETLVATLAILTESDPTMPVVISADKTTLYETVMNVMNQLKSTGTKKVGLLVKTPH